MHAVIILRHQLFAQTLKCYTTNMTQAEWIKKLEEEGYKEVSVHVFEPNQAFGDHTHDQATVHVILKGGMTLKDQNGEIVLKEGDRFEISKDTTHSAMCGPESCIFIAGVKE